MLQTSSTPRNPGAALCARVSGDGTGLSGGASCAAAEEATQAAAAIPTPDGDRRERAQNPKRCLPHGTPPAYQRYTDAGSARALARLATSRCRSCIAAYR